jgi:uncharacterized protein YidB (DUF937 family)
MALLNDVISRVGAAVGNNLAGERGQSLVQVIQQAGGLQRLASRFNSSGLSQVFNSWVAIGDNGAIRPEQIEAVLGNQMVQQLAQKLGIDTGKATETLAQLLHHAVDTLTPAGELEVEAKN